MDSILRYNFYLDNMPSHDMDCIDEDVETNILTKVYSNGTIKSRGKEVPLLDEVNALFIRTMNKLVFNKYLSNNVATDIFATPLVLPPIEQKLVPSQTFFTLFLYFHACVNNVPI